MEAPGQLPSLPSPKSGAAHRAYDQVTTYLRSKHVGMMGQRSYDLWQRSWVIARGKSVATRSMVMFKTCRNLLFQIVSGRTISRATGRATLRPVIPPIGCSLTLYNVEMFLGFRSLPIRCPTLLIIRSNVGGHDRSYDRSFMATTSRTIFSNRC